MRPTVRATSAPVAYESESGLPRFQASCSNPLSLADDISLVQRYAGACLLGRNLAQKILVLTGTAGGGKSTLLEIIERMLGVENVSQFAHGTARGAFEVARFIGKVLLTGKDVAGRFLETPGAHVLEEPRGPRSARRGAQGQQRQTSRCAATSPWLSPATAGLRVETGRGRGRMAAAVDDRARYERPKPEQPERDFAGRLLAEEGPGILRWMIEGARAHLAELRECGDYRLTPRQAAAGGCPAGGE